MITIEINDIVYIDNLYVEEWLIQKAEVIPWHICNNTFTALDTKYTTTVNFYLYSEDLPDYISYHLIYRNKADAEKVLQERINKLKKDLENNESYY